ncbi:uncharacterized protein LOC103022405 [Astyanax mexicanus]|uniref:uncharacterized protein LOC103022405 n=1 Tax=Astyanax mexicanus TaxID=7994 RepID=UPI0020CAAF3C|nr:uncharacterized protein LOC103022405 [Astyanax mexicanus]
MSSGNLSTMQMEKEARRRKFYQDKIRNRESLKSCGMNLITTVEKTITNHSREAELLKYFNEMLHSIFFLGYIHEYRLHPKDFVSTDEVHRSLSCKFPEPFIMYNSHLPTRTPFSILLEMMEILYETEERIKQELAILLKSMKFPNPLHKEGSKYEQYYTLESTVICVCYSNLDSRKYYGASFCCRKGNAKTILIDLSCLKTWHEYVSHAVMSFHGGASGDGITFPTELKCRAFYRDWKENVYNEKRPCANCKKLFNLPNADPDKVEHPFGNCAETECLSKLLKNDQYMQQKAMIPNHSEEHLEKLRNSTKARLTVQLRKAGIECTDNNFLFYNPCVKQNVTIC